MRKYEILVADDSELAHFRIARAMLEVKKPILIHTAYSKREAIKKIGKRVLEFKRELNKHRKMLKEARRIGNKKEQARILKITKKLRSKIKKPFDGVIADINMEYYGAGVDLLKHIKNKKFKMPVLVTSSTSIEHFKEDAEKAGADAIRPKKDIYFDTENVLKELLRRKG